MALPVWLDNLIAYSLQITILASAGTLLAYVFRLRQPRVSLIYWQVLLIACLLLPGLQSWHHPVLPRAVVTTGAFLYSSPPTPTAAETAKSAFSIPPEAVGLVLLAGACLRLLWLSLGFLRLRLFLRNSKPLPDGAQVSESLCSRIGVRVRFLVSDEIDSPATFGVVAPTVILPGSFHGMSEACREAVVCHELLHVRRRDWALIMVEEIIRSLYWFHPAVWWLLGRIRLAREQSVDHEVVRLTGSRQPYLDSLLEIARSRGRPKAVPAPLLLKERHLVQRVALLLKEVSMNRFRLAVSLAGIALLLSGTVRLAAGWFPLTGEPEVAQQQPSDAPPLPRNPIRVGGNVLESKLIRKVEPSYPKLARRARVQDNVVLVVTVDEEGNVSEIRVASGHPLLNEAAVSAVRQWKYSPTLLNGVRVPVIATVTVNFSLDRNGVEIENGSKAPPPPPGSYAESGTGDGAIHVMQSDGMGGSLILRASPVDEKGSPSPETFHAPQLAMSPEILRQWHTMAEAGWPADVAKKTSLSYMFVVNEVGEIIIFMRLQGPEIPELEREIGSVHVVSPGLRGDTPVRTLCNLTILL